MSTVSSNYCSTLLLSAIYPNCAAAVSLLCIVKIFIQFRLGHCFIYIYIYICLSAQTVEVTSLFSAKLMIIISKHVRLLEFVIMKSHTLTNKQNEQMFMAPTESTPQIQCTPSGQLIFVNIRCFRQKCIFRSSIKYTLISWPTFIPI